jgi:hypothetical protein
MPAYLTHKLASTAAYNATQNDQVKRIISENMTEYLSGAQGGDFVYFSHYYLLPASYKIKIYGWLVHRARPSEYLIKASKYVKTHYSEKLMAYYFGYLNHYCLDKYVHPHVYRDSHNLSSHTYLEQALDVMYADKFFNIDATKIKREEDLLSLISDVDELYAFHKHMAAAVYSGYGLPKGAYDKSYRWWAHMAKLTDQPSKWRKFWLKIYNVFLAFDIVAFIYKPRAEVEALYDYVKYYRCIQKSNEESISYMQLVYDFVHGKHDESVLASTFYNVNFLGLPVISWEERRTFRQAYRKAPTVK